MEETLTEGYPPVILNADETLTIPPNQLSVLAFQIIKCKGCKERFKKYNQLITFYKLKEIDRDTEDEGSFAENRFWISRKSNASCNFSSFSLDYHANDTTKQVGFIFCPKIIWIEKVVDRDVDASKKSDSLTKVQKDDFADKKYQN